MDPVLIRDVLLTPLQTVRHPKGDIYHAMKASAPGYQGFGEAYFSTIAQGQTKGWKRHNQLALNIVVPVGAIRFVIFDDREASPSAGKFLVIEIGLDFQYARLTVPPGLWVAFHGLDTFNLLMNITAEEHNPLESDNTPLEQIVYAWL
jgi:dTDP-4-dehydrorhamnose 3,5-epimerase